MLGNEEQERNKLESSNNSLTITDNRTGLTYALPIVDGTVNALLFKNITIPGQLEGIRIFDPAYQNTAVVRSSICYIDGEKGVLEYRGYPIEQLAEKSTFLEVAYLLIYGDLPDADQLKDWSDQVMRHTFVHVNFNELMKSFNYDAHPMGMFISSLAVMSTFHPEANPSLVDNDIFIKDEKIRNKQFKRILGKVTTIAANAYRHRIGRPFNLPQNHMTYTENFLYMMDRLAEKDYRPNQRLSRILDILFILHADHELNCSTAAMRHIGSSLVDPYSACAGAASALYGPLHGGANEAVLRMLEEIKDPSNVSEFLIQFYVIRLVFDIVGREPLIDVAVELERQALEDDYFVSRKLYPNVDFYSGLIYKAMGFPTDFFPVLFAIPRVAGWLAHWKESLSDPQSKIWRPRQIYSGEKTRDYVEINKRIPTGINLTKSDGHPYNKRSYVATFSK
ncbi:Citrate synthase, bacterial-type domain-containing protein [Rozella allomycis CSF55]|uniref:Citrate synthase n=1 Tax=Rozella allomycis (strain CSF55) TaxID=988480 RepID=A0A075AZJ8_ROZAC|nr:Citrate synthase, bacterial-type domain-containing protein [Rozella allomycis CSF55]|eukprot:EPZ35746.1 Citrate synthase, bacterial-type domain-containing protein [Rozella allomycis CSF55]